ncbi:MAG: aldose epimerase family protein [Clostridia bacterium]|nr:aldose epimerase family protein [Clostridia bacterium]
MVTTRAFGHAGTVPVTEYTTENAHGMRLSVIDYGARITHLTLPDGTETILGYDTAEQYAAGGESFGAVCGRYANRITGAKFTLNGETYTLEANENGNCLHGGFKGIAYKMYAVETDGNDLVMTLTDPDGANGFPGAMTLTVRYSLTDDDTLRISYKAVSDKDTILNITNHSYFNLADAETITGHRLSVNAPFITPVDAQLLPTGEIAPVDGTVFDLRQGVLLKDVLDPMDETLAPNFGYDNNFVLDKPERGALSLAATLTAPDGKTEMQCWTTEPAIQIYTANYLDVTARGGVRKGRNSAVCLETQHFPDSMRHTHFPSTVLRAGETYTQVTEYRFLFK